MITQNDILLISLIYLTAAVVFFLLFWRFISILKIELLVYMFRGLLASLIFTPWFINLQESTLAPALMVAMLDMITLGAAEIFRAGVPLFLSIFTFQAIALGFYIFEKKAIQKD
jgi:hypothetical protein